MDGHKHEGFKPPVPLKLSEIGLELTLMTGILLKTIFRRNLSDVIDIAESLSVSVPIAQELIDEIRASGLIETLGARGASTTASMRYQLTDSGRARALDALQQSEYYGSLPVPLADFWKQTERQKVKDVNIRREDLESSLSHLVMPEG
ncbi:MAG: ATPase, partial [Rhodobacteraceae bacterium]|nr:ATPase [Paracoccaceae bacterium]